MLTVLARGAAAVGVASVLVFAVPITSANAWVAPSPKVAGQMVIGAVRAAAPGAAKVAVTLPGRANPLGLAFTAGQLLYMTRDSWMPWVANAFGAGGASSVSPAGALDMSLTWSVNFSPTLDASAIDVRAVASAYTGYDVLNASWQCKSSIGTVTSGSGGSNGFVWEGGQSGDFHLGNCPTGSTLVSASAWAGNGKSNTLSWGQSFDPQTEATYEVSVDCRLADGTLATITKTTVSPQGGGLAIGSCDAMYPGSHGIGLRVGGARTGSPMVEQWRQDWNETSTLYPNCVGAGMACSYVLEYQGVPCVAGQSACINWALKSQANPADYQCKYGAYSLSLSGCGILERVYEPNGTTLTDLNTDGNPATADVTYPDWVPAPEPVPGAPAVGAPGGAPAPVTGGQTNPTATQTNNTDCWPSGVAAWNPAEWVLTPIKCALSWAFVPNVATLTVLKDGIKADLDRTGLPALGAAVAVPLTSVPGGSGCAGPEVVFAAGGFTFPVRPFSACDEPLRTAALMTHALFTVVIVVGGGLGLLRLVGAGFGFNVGFRGSGGDGS